MSAADYEQLNVGSVCGETSYLVESGIPVPAKGQPRGYSNASCVGKVPGSCILMDSNTAENSNSLRVI